MLMVLMMVGLTSDCTICDLTLWPDQPYCEPPLATEVWWPWTAVGGGGIVARWQGQRIVVIFDFLAQKDLFQISPHHGSAPKVSKLIVCIPTIIAGTQPFRQIQHNIYTLSLGDIKVPMGSDVKYWIAFIKPEQTKETAVICIEDFDYFTLPGALGLIQQIARERWCCISNFAKAPLFSPIPLISDTITQYAAALTLQQQKTITCLSKDSPILKVAPTQRLKPTFCFSHLILILELQLCKKWSLSRTLRSSCSPTTCLWHNCTRWKMEDAEQPPHLSVLYL